MGPGQVTFRHARVWVTQVVPDGLFGGLCFDRPLEPLVSPGTFFLSRSHSLQLKQPQRRRHDSVYINVSSALLICLISGKYTLLLNFSLSVKKVTLDCIFSKKKKKERKTS